MPFTSSEIWDICAEVFHRPEYRKEYVRLLSRIIGKKEKSILDTACGTGFPSLDLAKSGFLNITCIDGDPNHVKLMKTRIKKENLKIPVSVAKWQTMKIAKKFDVVMNADNSLVYMDSWMKDPEYSGEKIFGRLASVIKKFYTLTNENGILIVSLAKNNLKSNSKLAINLGNASGKEVIWDLTFDWKNRIKAAAMKVISDGVHERAIKSYLLTKEELKDLTFKAGFRKVQFFTSPGIYDDIIVGGRPRRNYLYIQAKSNSIQCVWAYFATP